MPEATKKLHDWFGAGGSPKVDVPAGVEVAHGGVAIDGFGIEWGEEEHGRHDVLAVVGLIRRESVRGR